MFEAQKKEKQKSRLVESLIWKFLLFFVLGSFFFFLFMAIIMYRQYI